MGIGVSGWQLARAVSMTGQMGVVSGTALDSLLIRRLQDGDMGGHVRRAMEAFPLQDVVEDILKKYYVPGGRTDGTGYKLLSMYREGVSKARERVTVLGSFVEVFLAREGHDGLVGMNLLTKVQLPNLATLYGAMLAGVDYILMGAGIPREIPGALDAMAEGRPASIRLDVDNLPSGSAVDITFSPEDHLPAAPVLKRPAFLPIISSNLLATMLARKANGRVDGFIIEAPTAGGHNAPPRGSKTLNERGEPVYGDRDVVDLGQVAELGLPFWLAGSTGSPESLVAAQEAGAAGIQVGTLFAYCEESGLDPALREAALRKVEENDADVFTHPQASPTGFPFKVVNLDGSLADEAVFSERERICDLGYLRVPYLDEKGRMDYRCPAEPVEVFIRKGGKEEQTEGRRCLCNALMATIGPAQVREGAIEPALLTSGDDLVNMRRFTRGRTRYSARDVIDYLLGTS
jgi:nitronate monooxygenase